MSRLTLEDGMDTTPIDVSRSIEEGDEPLCPLCDQPILFADARLATAHGAFFLICGFCADSEYEDA